MQVRRCADPTKQTGQTRFTSALPHIPEDIYGLAKPSNARPKTCRIQQHQTKRSRRLAWLSDVKRCISEDTRRRTLSNRDCPKTILAQQSRTCRPNDLINLALLNRASPKVGSTQQCQTEYIRKYKPQDDVRQ